MLSWQLEAEYVWNNISERTDPFYRLKRRRLRGRVGGAPHFKSGGRGLKSRFHHEAGVVSWQTPVQLFGLACK